MVKDSYNKIASHYSENRDQFKNDKYLFKLTELLNTESIILDVGCGSGKPIDQFLINNGFKVIGLDISEEQITLAKKNVPQAQFKVQDMMELEENEYSVEAVVSFYAIFHTPREQHLDLLKKFYSYLKEDGMMLVTMGSSDWEGTEDDFHGAQMYWSHFGKDKNRKLVEEAGFEIIEDEIDLSGGEKHQVILARKN